MASETSSTTYTISDPLNSSIPLPDSLSELQKVNRLHEKAAKITPTTCAIFVFCPVLLPAWFIARSFKKLESLTNNLKEQTESIEEISEKNQIIRMKPTETDSFDYKDFFKQIKSKTTSLEKLEEDELILSTIDTAHRFDDIPCPKETALKVDDSFLHANWIEMPDGHVYIAAQAPLENEKFWKAVYEQRCLIVDLTTTNDLEDEEEKYYPETKDKTEKYGEISVTLKSESLFALRYTVSYQDSSKTLERVHFNKWPDHKGADLESLVELLNQIDSWMKEHPKQPVLVHCRAGVGRSGTLITMLTLKHLIEKDRKEGAYLNMIEEIILQGRKCRGPCFVQSRAQFRMILEYVDMIQELEI